jgi:hypothetical protein
MIHRAFLLSDQCVPCKKKSPPKEKFLVMTSEYLPTEVARAVAQFFFNT